MRFLHMFSVHSVQFQIWKEKASNTPYFQRLKRKIAKIQYTFHHSSFHACYELYIASGIETYFMQFKSTDGIFLINVKAKQLRDNIDKSVCRLFVVWDLQHFSRSFVEYWLQHFLRGIFLWLLLQ